jgi:hypothetical protein
MTEQSDGSGAGGEPSGVSVSEMDRTAGDATRPAVGIVGRAVRVRSASELALEIARGYPRTLDGTEESGRVRDRRRSWRAVVAEDSMVPALEPGDWLLLDPTVSAWPRRGSVVVIREPHSGLLAIKRVAARPGDRIRTATGVLVLAAGDAWLLGDNAAVSIDSRRYGPVPLNSLVARAWLRYGPPGRIGRIGRR